MNTTSQTFAGRYITNSAMRVIVRKAQSRRTWIIEERSILTHTPQIGKAVSLYKLPNMVFSQNLELKGSRVQQLSPIQLLILLGTPFFKMVVGGGVFGGEKRVERTVRIEIISKVYQLQV